MRTIVLLLLVLVTPGICFSANPQLIIVISLDQFPYEYLTRFRPWLHGGLATLLDHGAVCANANYNHVHCTTGPGHAVLLTGSYGDMNGIVLNTWYDREHARAMYCVGDDQATIVGASGQGMSPRNLLQSTFGDMLRLHTGYASKVISVSNKDRAAILLGGRLPSQVYWMMDSVFVSSSYYLGALPEWVARFNRSGIVNRFFGSAWEQSLPDSAFMELDRDDVPYEADHDGLGRTFPHRITGSDRTRISSSYYNALLTSPFGALPLNALAEQAIAEERLGMRGVTDLLCISYSSTDYVGHTFGPQSHEVLEMTVAIDRTIGQLFAFVDSTVGLNHCLIALSSDHGISPIPEYVQSHSPAADAGRVQTAALRASCEAAMNATFGEAPGHDSWIASINDHEIYFNGELLSRKNLDISRAADIVAARLQTIAGVADTWNLTSSVGSWGKPWDDRVLKSFYKKRSGDVLYVLRPFWIEGNGEGTTHGDPYQYNSHVPLIFMGPSIREGMFMMDVSPADLAPTISAAVGVEFPAGREGRVIWEVLRSPLNSHNSSQDEARSPTPR